MTDIREIVTKAVIGKARKVIENDTKITSREPIGRVLGTMMLNHDINAHFIGDQIEVSGTYDVHVWHTDDKEQETLISKEAVAYKSSIQLENQLRDYFLSTDEINAFELRSPSSANVWIEDSHIVVEVSLEIGVEVIGEAKMRVAILEPIIELGMDEEVVEGDFDYLNEIDTQVQPHFLEAEIMPFD